jgi:hypothetical protein
MRIEERELSATPGVLSLDGGVDGTSPRNRIVAHRLYLIMAATERAQIVRNGIAWRG